MVKTMLLIKHASEKISVAISIWIAIAKDDDREYNVSVFCVFSPYSGEVTNGLFHFPVRIGLKFINSPTCTNGKYTQLKQNTFATSIKEPIPS